MNTFDNLDDVPFVNEECGDTMWDETLLDQLSGNITQQQPALSISAAEAVAPQPVNGEAHLTNSHRTE